MNEVKRAKEGVVGKEWKECNITAAISPLPKTPAAQEDKERTRHWTIFIIRWNKKEILFKILAHKNVTYNYFMVIRFMILD